MTVSPNTDAVSASVSGVAWWKTPCPRREVRVQSVAELVREREHVAPARRPVQQHVRVVRRHGVRAERARALARHGPARRSTRRRRNAARCRRARPRTTRTRRARAPSRFVPADLRLDVGDRRHAVVVGEAVDAEQARLQRVPALRDRVAALHRFDERLHRLVARLVREVAARDPAVEVAQPVVDRLVGEQRVQHERRVRSPGSRPAVTASAAVRRTSRSGACSRPSAASSVVVSPSSSTRDRRHLLFEQPLPRARAGDRLLGEDDLFGLGEQVRPVAALRAQVVTRRTRAARRRAASRPGRRRARPTRARRTGAWC